MPTVPAQRELFESAQIPFGRPRKVPAKETSGTFSGNLKLPIHRWFRYSAGFSAGWVKNVIAEHKTKIVLDPFVGSGTVCVVADEINVSSYGVESHPFVYRLAKGKLSWASDINEFQRSMAEIEGCASRLPSRIPSSVPALLTKCYSQDALATLLKFREAYSIVAPRLPDNLRALTFLAVNAILRPSSHAGTAQWQYILPNKRKMRVSSPAEALATQTIVMADDMRQIQHRSRSSKAHLIQGDARTLDAVPDNAIDLVVTSPPYANNYDYADATRLEMTFWGEIDSWGDLHDTVRKFLIRSSSQHSSKDRLELDVLLTDPLIDPIRNELSVVCRELEKIRGTKGGNKSYHTMIAAYFSDMSATFRSLRRVTTSGCNLCFVIGDSAPYGVYVPVEQWFGQLAVAAGFRSWSFEKIRDRNVKWKNRKHRVPLHEGRVWITG